MADTFRSLRALERTASTSRVLNLAALSVKHADNPQHIAQPFFVAPALNTAVVLKHRLRANEAELIQGEHRIATKLIVPFERSDLGLGGRSLFVGERGWKESLAALSGYSPDLERDAAVLEALNELPSLDPFLLREHLQRRGFEISETNFEISRSVLDRMQQFVGSEIARLIDLAYASKGGNQSNSVRLAEALLSNRNEERLEPLRLTLRLEGEDYREGMFSWKGFLYYKWVLNSLWPKLKTVMSELPRVKIIGPRDSEGEALIRMQRARLQTSIERQVRAVSDFLKTYDQVFEELTTEGNTSAFRTFLLKSPQLLVQLGEGTGAISHIASFWRFRFPESAPLKANVVEMLDILTDFEAGLSGDLPAPGVSQAA